MQLQYIADRDVRRFRKYVDLNGPLPDQERYPGLDRCHIWTGARNTNNYGRFYLKGKAEQATKVSWEIANDCAAPAGLYMLHACDNPPCVNAKHVRPGTQRENLQEAWDRQRFTPWDRAGENNSRAVLTLEDVAAIRAIRGRMPRRALAERYGVSESAISAARGGRNWKVPKDQPTVAIPEGFQFGLSLD